MSGSEMIAYAAGVCLLAPSTGPDRDALDAKKRARMLRGLERYERACGGCVTVCVRWMLRELPTVPFAALRDEVLREFARRTPRFEHVVALLRGHYEARESAELDGEQMATLMQELRLVEDGLPPRYQELFFELATHAHVRRTARLDAAPLFDALLVGKYDFPPLQSLGEAADAADGGDRARGQAHDGNPTARAVDSSAAPPGDVPTPTHDHAASREQP